MNWQSCVHLKKKTTIHKTMWETALKLGGVIDVHAITYDLSGSVGPLQNTDSVIISAQLKMGRLSYY